MEHPYPVWRMPRYPRWPTALVFASPLVALALNYLVHTYWFWGIPVVVLGFVSCHQMFRIRCPQCSRRMQRRIIVRPETKQRDEQHHIFFDCAHCKATWDPDISVSASVDGS